MIKKEFTPKRTVCKITFAIPAEWASKEVAVAGDFNNWSTSSDKLSPENGYWSGVVRLKPGNKYKFKYLVDGEHWVNDDNADTYIANEFGTEDSVINVGN